MIAIAYNDNGLNIIHPFPWLPVQENQTEDDYWQMLAQVTADKDVPAGVSYKFVNTDYLPNRDFRNAWIVNITDANKDGVGLTKKQFEAKYPNIKGVAVQ